MPTPDRAILPYVTLFALAAGAASADTPLLTLHHGDQTLPISAADVAEIDLSELGGRTDVFITLMPGAGNILSALSVPAGERLEVAFCGITLQTPPIRPPLTGHVYIEETTFLRGDALRAVWHGRTSCDRLAPEVFNNGQ
jgi:hypothetical protein